MSGWSPGEEEERHPLHLLAPGSQQLPQGKHTDRQTDWVTAVYSPSTLDIIYFWFWQFSTSRITLTLIGSFSVTFDLLRVWTHTHFSLCRCVCLFVLQTENQNRSYVVRSTASFTVIEMPYKNLQPELPSNSTMVRASDPNTHIHAPRTLTHTYTRAAW